MGKDIKKEVQDELNNFSEKFFKTVNPEKVVEALKQKNGGNQAQTSGDVSETPKDFKLTTLKGSIEILFTDLEDAMRYMYKTTENKSLSDAFEIIWHRSPKGDKEGQRKAELVLTVWRIRQDGSLVPPLDIAGLYYDVAMGRQLTLAPDPSPSYQRGPRPKRV